jgi:hypothetical protein
MATRLKIASVLFLTVVVWMSATTLVRAHGAATSMQKVVGKYLVEFEYNQLGNPPAGDFIAYNFDILDEKTLEFEKFKNVFVRFAANDDKETIANATLAPDQFNPKNARMGVSLPEAGVYTVTVRFYDESDEEMASATYELTVDRPYGSSDFLSHLTDYTWMITLVIGLLLGLGVRRLFRSA